MKQTNIRIKNKRATFDYEISDRFVAGIVLVGTEIKALREGKANLSDSFCIFINGELWVKNISISTYSYGSYNNHNPRRDRKLLLQSKELRKLERSCKEKGNTIIPTIIFINEKGLAKLEIALATGKKEFDKRESIKLKEDKRTMDRIMKSK